MVHRGFAATLMMVLLSNTMLSRAGSPLAMHMFDAPRVSPSAHHRTGPALPLSTDLRADVAQLGGDFQQLRRGFARRRLLPVPPRQDGPRLDVERSFRGYSSTSRASVPYLAAHISLPCCSVSTRGSYCCFADNLDRLVPTETPLLPQNLEPSPQPRWPHGT